MTSHWPTYADGLFWCACENKTFETQDKWQHHVLMSMLKEHFELRDRLAALPDELDALPVDVAVEQPHRGS